MMTRTKPLLIYDGNCGFCKKWIALWMQWSGDRVDYAPSQSAAQDFPEIPAEYYDQSVILVLPSGQYLRGAHAVLAALAYNPAAYVAKFLLACYLKLGPFRWLIERAYALVAKNRIPFSYLTYWLWGDEVKPSTYVVSRWAFLRGLSLVYFVAFASIGLQLPGLIGSNGIFTPGSFTDAQVRLVQLAGMGFSVLLFIGFAPILNLILLWFCYWFFADLSRDFLWFQWDALLLEVGFLAILFAPWTLLPFSPSRGVREKAPSPFILFLLRFVLFKVIFFSGWVKLTSGDPNWANLTAIGFHYETQPLPTWVSWYAHKLPEWFHIFSAVGMFALELGASFLFFMPRKARLLGFFAVLFLQFLIDLTGNYGFFGWLVVCLALLLPDDQFWKRWIPQRWFPRVDLPVEPSWKRWAVGVVGLILFLVNWTTVPFFSKLITDFRVVNQYGVFAIMTTQRDEIVLEGSDDGNVWTPYELKWKPGDLSRPPGFVEPHMPRLDWQMWFAALSQDRPPLWFMSMVVRLLQGSSEVAALFRTNPFPDHPPRWIRAQRYQYQFTDWEERADSGNWWKRALIGPFGVPWSLENLSRK
ncbi:MAG: lipase maturation factor family protein [Bdellovibrio sp.]|nr:lipase maturation factor family protein [Bdellovibrio sp.]